MGRQEARDTTTQRPRLLHDTQARNIRSGCVRAIAASGQTGSVSKCCSSYLGPCQRASDALLDDNMGRSGFAPAPALPLAASRSENPFEVTAAR